MASRSSMRTRTVPSLTTSPRSTRTWVTRPSISEATSVWVSAMRAPVTSRPMGSIRSSAGATETAIALAAVSGCADGLASVLPQPARRRKMIGTRTSEPCHGLLWAACAFIGDAPREPVDQRCEAGRFDRQCAHPGQPRLRAGSVRAHPVPLKFCPMIGFLSSSLGDLWCPAFPFRQSRERAKLLKRCNRLKIRVVERIALGLRE